MPSLKFTALPMVAILFAFSASTLHSQTHSPPPETSGKTSWHLLLAHDAKGEVEHGNRQHIINAVRQGCRIRVAWGSKGSTRTIEHIADPMWISIRDSDDIEVQIGNLMINLKALGEPSEDHPRRKRFGGTEKVVKWRATLKTDGSFDAVWYYPHNGDFIARVPQRHPMRWFADCMPVAAEPLFSTTGGE